MKRTNLIILIGVILVLLITFFLFIKPDKNGQEKALHEQFSNPFGTSYIYKLLSAYSKTKELNEIDSITFSNYKKSNKTYISINPKRKFSEAGYNKIKDFVSKGNDAFIIQKDDFPQEIKNKYQLTLGIKSDTCESLHLTHKNLKGKKELLIKLFKESKIVYDDWHFFKGKNIQGKNISVLGVNQKNQPNFLRIKIDKGNLYIHSSPQAFYNQVIFEEEGLEYAEGVFSHINKNTEILWDKNITQLKTYENKSSDDNNFDNSNPKREYSKLGIILSKPSLAWAYFLAIFTVLLYIIFNSKRKQKVIPAIQPKENKTLGFNQTISDLYKSQNRRDMLASQIGKNLNSYIENKYFLKGNYSDKKFVERLASKSGISSEKIIDLFKNLESFKANANMSTNDLINLNQKIEYFYHNSL